MTLEAARDARLIREPWRLPDLAQVPAADRRWWWPLGLRAAACVLRCGLPARVDVAWPSGVVSAQAARMPPGLDRLARRLGFELAWSGPAAFAFQPFPSDGSPAPPTDPPLGPLEEPDAVAERILVDTHRVDVRLALDARGIAATALLVPRPETDPGSLRSAIERWIELHPFVGAAAPEVAVEGGSLVVRGGLDLSRETVV